MHAAFVSRAIGLLVTRLATDKAAVLAGAVLLEVAADVKAASGASVHTDKVGTVSTVLWESGADVEDRAGSGGDGSMAAASGAAATAGSMQVVEEVIKELDL